MTMHSSSQYVLFAGRELPQYLMQALVFQLLLDDASELTATGRMGNSCL